MPARPFVRCLSLVAMLCIAMASLPTGTYAATSFANSSAITIVDSASASPYPSSIAVSGLSGQVITKLTVTLTGLSHTYPSDVDLLLVGPAGQNLVLMSDAGSGGDVTGINLTFDDTAASSLPDASQLSSGTYRPTNFVAGDTFPAPAPSPSSATGLAVFNGSNPNGTWKLYLVDDAAGDFGSISGGWSLSITSAPPAAPGDLVISEFRLRGPSGANDEFVEIYNNTGVDHTVGAIDGSAGYALAASNGTIRFTIPNGTVIPAYGHYLGVNSVAYSLASYPSGNGTTATGDATFTTDICDNCGIALFNTANGPSFDLAHRLDAVGATSEANTLFKEGAGYPALTPFSIDYSFYRDLKNGSPKDTNSNANDFVFVDTNGTSAGAGQRLGAPGPENLASPLLASLPGGSALRAILLDPSVASTVAPNQVRDFTSDPANNSTFGTLSIRRKITNTTGAAMTRLRIRIVDLTTFPSPSGTSDLRPRSSGTVLVTIPGVGNVTVLGTTLEQPPSQPNGGGLNSTFSVPAVTQANPLAAGASIYVQFLLGVQQDGTYRFTTDVPDTGAIQLSAATYSVAESAGSAAITVTRTGGTAPGVTVSYTTANGTAAAGSDYTTASGTVTFGAGETSKTIQVPILTDTVDENDETLTITLSSPGGGATLGATTSATLTIVDDEVVTEHLVQLPHITR